MDHVYMDDEALEASDLSCFVMPPIGNSDVSILDLSESMPKPNFLDKVKTLVSKKTAPKASKRTLLQQIQSIQFHEEEAGSPSSYRKTTKIWAFKIVPFKEPSKK